MNITGEDVIDSYELTKSIFVVHKTFKGKEYFDIRKYYVDNNGETKPTTKGVMIEMEKLEELQEILNRLNKLK